MQHQKLVEIHNNYLFVLDDFFPMLTRSLKNTLKVPDFTSTSTLGLHFTLRVALWKICPSLSYSSLVKLKLKISALPFTDPESLVPGKFRMVLEGAAFPVRNMWKL